MVHLLWGILNVGLWFFFLGIYFAALKLVRGKYGFWVSLVFLFGLVFVVGGSVSSEINSTQTPYPNQIKTWTFASTDSLEQNTTFRSVVTLEKTLTYRYELGIYGGIAKDSPSKIPTSANSWTTGFVSGITWKPQWINVAKTGDNTKLAYDVRGITEWRLLGMLLYSQIKEYKGTVAIR